MVLLQMTGTKALTSMQPARELIIKQQTRTNHQPADTSLVHLLIPSACALAGGRDHFEDRYALQPDFQPEPGAAAADLNGAGQSGGADAQPQRQQSQRQAQEAAANQAAAGQALQCSYAGVFDGHSAADAAETAKERLHMLLAGELGACQRWALHANC